MAELKLNKRLYIDINRLRLLNKIDSQPRFLLDESPFNDDDDDEELAATANLKEIIVVGRILPNSEIYREGAFKIQMKLTQTHPRDPPEVRFITPIYHPNITKDGQFCNELLKKMAKSAYSISLVEVIRAVVKHVDEPNIDYSQSMELGREYMENKSEFDRKAMEYVKKYALPRF